MLGEPQARLLTGNRLRLDIIGHEKSALVDDNCCHSFRVGQFSDLDLEGSGSMASNVARASSSVLQWGGRGTPDPTWKGSGFTTGILEFLVR